MNKVQIKSIIRREHIHRPAAGAWVCEPQLGLHKYIGCTDINSLYPSAIRSLNMSPETILGQLRSEYTEKYLLNKIETEKLYKHKGRQEPDWAAAWGGIFNVLEVDMVWKKTNDLIWIDFEDADSVQLTAKEIYELIFEQSNGSICMSANGTLFKTDVKGIIPSVLEKWYVERVSMKKKMKKCFDEGKEKEGQYWYLQQYVRKIQLNSLYGCLLQNGSKFYDNRLGQSTTLTGRCITRFMTAKINKLITGVEDEYGDACIAGDTDSVVGKTIIETNQGNKTIEELYDICSKDSIWNDGNKEYSCSDIVKVLSYNKDIGKEQLYPISYVYRHKTNKECWEIKDEDGNIIQMTDDHSVMIERNGELIEVKPRDIRTEDFLIQKC